MNALVRSEASHRNSTIAVGPRPPAPVFAKPQPISFFTSNAEIYAQGETAGNFYRIEFGAVRIYRLLSDGRRQIAAFHLAGETFGFEADLTHHFFAEAIVATCLCTHRVSAGETLSQDLLPLALRYLARAQKHLLVVGRQNAVERIAAFLIDIADRQGGLEHIELSMSRQDIADYLGLTIETVSRGLTKLRDTGFIKFHGLRVLDICKPQALRLMCE
ncbi:helix-turn-helix domain-containing protein [Rhizobium sp. PP-CC-3G-465]|uniref:helix-turn-helix domain-containing protein n=1 Tax=Rhizobium sp. PP-CC-3G-465 TaxID=2135648 RepID=UPI00104F97EA|nr:CRP/FNR family nitrogen fixation transcriptional regulator [Rhizobium sp. PP-CC-3G-465]